MEPTNATWRLPQVGVGDKGLRCGIGVA